MSRLGSSFSSSSSLSALATTPITPSASLTISTQPQVQPQQQQTTQNASPRSPLPKPPSTTALFASPSGYINPLQRTISTQSMMSLGPTPMHSVPSAQPGPAPGPAPAAPAPIPSAAPSISAPAMSSSTAPIFPLQPLVKFEDKIRISQLSRTYVTNHSGLVVGLSKYLPIAAQQAVLEYIDLFTMSVLSYSQQWYYIVAALSLDYTCVLSNILTCDFFVTIEDLPSALQCLQRVKMLCGDEYQTPPVFSISLNQQPQPHNQQPHQQHPFQTHHHTLATHHNHLPNVLDLTTHSIIPSNEVVLAPTTVTKREILYYHAYEKWLTGKLPESLSYFLTIVSLYPMDIFALKRSQLLAFLMGNQAVMLNVQLVRDQLQTITTLHKMWWSTMTSAIEHYMYLHNADLQQQQQVQQTQQRTQANKSAMSTSSTTSSSIIPPSALSSKHQAHNWISAFIPLLQARSDLLDVKSLSPNPSQPQIQTPSSSQLLKPSQQPQLHPNQPPHSATPTLQSNTQLPHKLLPSTPSNPAFRPPTSFALFNTFSRLSYYFGMLSFALEQSHLFLPALHSGYFGTLISFIQQQFYQLFYNNVSITGSPTNVALFQPNQRTQSSSSTSLTSIPHHHTSTTPFLTNNFSSPSYNLSSDPWSHHGMFHALFSLCEHRLAIPLALSLSPQWNRSMSFMFTHNWFHVGLMLIEQAQFFTTLAIVDTVLWRFEPAAIPSDLFSQASIKFDDSRYQIGKKQQHQQHQQQQDREAPEANPTNGKLVISSNNQNTFTLTKPDIRLQHDQPSQFFPWKYLGEGMITHDEHLIIQNTPQTQPTTPKPEKQIGFFFNVIPTASTFLTTLHPHQHQELLGFLARHNEKSWMFNFHHSFPTWNIYYFLRLLGYRHDDDPMYTQQTAETTQQGGSQQSPLTTLSTSQLSDAPGGATPHQLVLYTGDGIDAVLTRTTQTAQISTNNPSDSTTNNNNNTNNSNNSNNINTNTPSQHEMDLFHQATIPLPWKGFDVNYPIRLQQEHRFSLHKQDQQQQQHHDHLQQQQQQPKSQAQLQLPQLTESMQFSHSHPQTLLPQNTQDQSSNATTTMLTDLQPLTPPTAADPFTYDEGHYAALSNVIPLVNKAHTQDQTGAIGLLWRLELHAFIDAGLTLCHVVDVGSANSNSDANSTPTEQSIQNNGRNELSVSHDNQLQKSAPNTITPTRSLVQPPPTISCLHCIHQFQHASNQHQLHSNNVLAEHLSNGLQDNHVFPSSPHVLFNAEADTITPIDSPYTFSTFSPPSTTSSTSPTASSYPIATLQPHQLLIPCTNDLLNFPSIPSLSHRYLSILASVNFHNTHQDPFFDILVCALLSRCQKVDELQFYIEQATITVDSTPQPRKQQLQQVFLPLINSFLAFTQCDYQTAANLLVAIFTPQFAHLPQNSQSLLTGQASAQLNAQLLQTPITPNQDTALASMHTVPRQAGQSIPIHPQIAPQQTLRRHASQCDSQPSLKTRQMVNQIQVKQVSASVQQQDSSTTSPSRVKNRRTTASVSSTSSNSQFRSKTQKGKSSRSQKLTNSEESGSKSSLVDSSLPQVSASGLNGIGDSSTVDIFRLLSIKNPNIVKKMTSYLFSHFSIFVSGYLRYIQAAGTQKRTESEAELASDPNSSHFLGLQPLSPFTCLFNVQAYLQRRNNPSQQQLGQYVNLLNKPQPQSTSLDAISQTNPNIANTAISGQHNAKLQPKDPTNKQLQNSSTKQSKSPQLDPSLSPTPPHLLSPVPQPAPTVESPPVSTQLVSLNFDNFSSIGGSNEQRDVIVDYFCVVLYLAKHYDILLAVLNARIQDRNALWLHKFKILTLSAMNMSQKVFIKQHKFLAKL